MRPLTAAVAAAGRGTFVLDGVARMRERPIADLVDGLVQLGVDATCTMGTGCPPVEVKAAGLPSGKVRGWMGWVGWLVQCGAAAFVISHMPSFTCENSAPDVTLAPSPVLLPHTLSSLHHTFHSLTLFLKNNRFS